MNTPQGQTSRFITDLDKQLQTHNGVLRPKPVIKDTIKEISNGGNTIYGTDYSHLIPLHSTIKPPDEPLTIEIETTNINGTLPTQLDGTDDLKNVLQNLQPKVTHENAQMLPHQTYENIDKQTQRDAINRNKAMHPYRVLPTTTLRQYSTYRLNLMHIPNVCRVCMGIISKHINRCVCNKLQEFGEKYQ